VGNAASDGVADDSGKARRLFHLAFRDQPATTLIELENPAGDVIDHSTGAYINPHSLLTH
jgi:hypothetical protein